ncbi:hypothetical protein HU200_008609 [Digitaria exilis]|uniref:Uncharacterized protein n=1 Tax=Digitaria exilis TaxID=1010633 RepID=A0A835KQ81_9POAL|nr:hypothetical protein HU200_008609 [Digitaria exilis]
MSRVMPSTLALMAVQRQAAASRSARPPRMLQHGSAGGWPTSALTRPATLAHAASLSAFLGHLPLVDGEGDGGVGVGGVGVGQPPPQAVVVAVERTRMRATRRKALDAMGTEKKKKQCVLAHSATARRILAGATVDGNKLSVCGGYLGIYRGRIGSLG